MDSQMSERFLRNFILLLSACTPVHSLSSCDGFCPSVRLSSFPAHHPPSFVVAAAAAILVSGDGPQKFILNTCLDFWWTNNLSFHSHQCHPRRQNCVGEETTTRLAQLSIWVESLRPNEMQQRWRDEVADVLLLRWMGGFFFVSLFVSTLGNLGGCRLADESALASTLCFGQRGRSNK